MTILDPKAMAYNRVGITPPCREFTQTRVIRNWLAKDVDEHLRGSILEVECPSSATSERLERIGEGSSKDIPGSVESLLVERADERSSGRGEDIMEKHTPRSFAHERAQGVDMRTIIANAVRFARTATPEEVAATLRRAREVYRRRYPNNVPPSDD